MLHPTAPRIFVIYAPEDGLAFAQELQSVLGGAGLSPYRDLADLKDAPDRWWQIETTIKIVDHVIVVLTPKALRADYISSHWRLGLRAGKNVWPVVGPGRLTFTGLPRWMRHAKRYDIGTTESRESLIAGLTTLALPRAVPFVSDFPSEGFVRRPEKLGEIKSKLLDGHGKATTVTAALCGAGGSGKTSLANALCHDPDIRAAFDGGILRVTLGENPDDLVRTMAEFIFRLDGRRPDVARVEDARTMLAEALDGRRCLLVIDDARRLGDLEPFLRLGPRDRATRLITTRDDRILPPEAERVTVDAMTLAQALEMLARDLPEETLKAHYARLGALAGRLGESPLLLGLANGVLRSRLARGAGPEDALDHLEQPLETPGQQRQMTARTLDLSLEQLHDSERDRFTELGVFAADAEIPVQAALGLWQQTAQLAPLDGETLLARLDGLSLLLRLDRSKGTFRLHDTFRELLRSRQPPYQLAALNRGLIAHFRSTCLDGDLAHLADAYGLRHAISHLRDGGEDAAADALMLDPRWMQSKLEVLGIKVLISDYFGYSHDTAQGLIGTTLTLVADSIARRPQELAPQLLGRLSGDDAPGLKVCLSKALTRSLTHWIARTLVPLHPTLVPPGPELRRFEGHEDAITSMAVLPDRRRALSGSRDNTLRLWDIESGAAVRRFEGHGHAITSVAVLPGGRRAVSGSKDNTMRLWDIGSGTELRRFAGHEGPVTAIAVLPGGRRALTASEDGTLRLWDIDSGAQLRCFEGHEDWVNCVAILPDGRRALSASDDNTVRVWDIDSGIELRRFDELEGVVISMTVLADGQRALSGFDDNSFRLWDLESGLELQCFEGHEGWVTSLAMLPDGRRALSASDDKSVCLWDIEAGVELQCFRNQESDESYESEIPGVIALVDARRALWGAEGNSLRLWDFESSLEPRGFERHEGAVKGLSLLDDGLRVLSVGQDETFRLWDISSGAQLRRFDGHERGATSVALLPGGRRILSASYDHTLRLWDIASGAELRRFEGHKDVVTCAAVLPGGRRVLSGSLDGTLRLWNIASGTELRRFKGHSAAVTCVAPLANGRRALSGSFDNSLRLWDVASGAELRYFEGHEDRVHCVAVLQDGRTALSGSDDCTMRLWDIDSGAELRRFGGHRNRVSCVTVLPDGRRALSGSCDNLRLWDIESGVELASLALDGYVDAIAWSETRQLAVVGDGFGGVHTIWIVDDPFGSGSRMRV